MIPQLSRHEPVVADQGGLLDQLRNGDEDAYRWFVEAHAGRMLATARRLLRNEEDARDAVQEAFLSAFQAIDRFREASTLATWLHRVVTNAALMRLRRAAHRPEAPLDHLLPKFDETGHHADPVDPWAPNAETLMLQEETRRTVRSLIDTLPESYRTVLILRDIEELDAADTAAMLGITTNAVKVRLHRARQALLTLLTPAFADRASQKKPAWA
jgi:RNA polymerase sigma-70 factor, ECF subfamily